MKLLPRNREAWLKLRGAEWLALLDQSITTRGDDGSTDHDENHPAFRKAFNVKYGRDRNTAPPETYPNGLGTRIRNGIDIASIGLAGPIVSAISLAFTGKDCRCGARERCLNHLVPDVAKVGPVEWVKLLPQLLACVGKNDDF